MTHWWDEMARTAEAAGLDPFSADWYRAIRDLHRERFPDADARTLTNMDDMIRRADA